MGLFDFLGLSSDAESSVNNTITTKLVGEAISTTIMKCGRSALLSQSVEIVGSGNNVNIKQTMVFQLDASCVNKAENISEMQQNVIAAIESAAQSQNVGLLGLLANSSAEVNTTITNDVKSVINNTTMTELVSKVQLAQKVMIYGDNNIAEITQDMTADILDQACQDVANRLSAVQKIDAKVKANATAKVDNPLDGLFDFLQGMGWMYVLIVIAVIIAAVFLAINARKLIRGSDGKNDNETLKELGKIMTSQRQQPAQPQPQQA